MTYRRLTRAELPVDTEAMARFLIGKIIVRETPHSVISGRIVETEASFANDAAGPAFLGVTPRNRALLLAPGHAHVYLNHGVSWMLNVSSEAAGVGAGVLIRALAPLDGVEIMRQNRGETALQRMTRGPGKLTEALRIEGWADGLDLSAEGPLWLGSDDQEPGAIGQGSPIVRPGATVRGRRFYRQGDPFVSGPQSLSP